MVGDVDIPYVDVSMGALGEISKHLEPCHDCDQISDEGEINDSTIGTNVVGETIVTNSEIERGNENVEENINDVFNRIYVTNMIKTCVDKLGTEYERGTCRKVASVGENLDDMPMKEEKEENDDDGHEMNEVHLDLTCPSRLCFWC